MYCNILHLLQEKEEEKYKKPIEKLFRKNTWLIVDSREAANEGPTVGRTCFLTYQRTNTPA